MLEKDIVNINSSVNEISTLLINAASKYLKQKVIGKTSLRVRGGMI